MKTIIFMLISALIITSVIEMIPHLLFNNKARRIKTSILCNVVTNPLLNTILLLFGIFIPSTIVLFVITIILEFIVIYAEARLYTLVLDEHFSKTMKISAICNTFSFLSGIIFDNIF